MLGAYAQATLSGPLTPVINSWFDLTATTARSAAIVTVLVTLTAVQLILGELVPKAIALQYPTQTALATVLPMQWSLVVFRPFIGCSTARRSCCFARLARASRRIGICTRRKRSIC